ncbi:NAD(P)/FAD-dependent oxidoreductase [Candidatus Viadribacter manganicus]|uniref:NADH-ubiquinone oxidoreductase subunit 6 n=1 Tax=Candidatus Viadribacter manganicus TaxID=1759059 RepID=A0A1B1AFQ0_9PROT|nr:FAD-dependent oxidoreductase [Candidatus Viadribacter manganicus]ANP45382.1 NADH-ubiquinone oxidoreductase subunit 6 [Candidatus Viadribacter manganicus]
MAFTSSSNARRQNIAVIGSGIAGMSAAWLLSQKHDVTVYEKNGRLGGHSNTVTVETSLGPTPVDTGFIVFNDATYPNLIALFQHLGVETKVSDMSFGVSLRGGDTEYSSVDTSAFLCGGRNLISPRFWSMTWDLLRFYRRAPLELLATRDSMISLGEYLDHNGYGDAFQRDHLLPQAAAIWSASMGDIHHYPACAFVRFFENHGLLKLKGRPAWRTVEGGSRAYVEKLTANFADRARLNAGAVSVRREAGGVWVRDAHGRVERYDDVVIATHGDEALAMLEDPSAEERALLGAFRYAKNRAVLHTDTSFMPRREPLWASWNYVGDSPEGGCVVSYWMNKLQNIQSREQIFLTLNPRSEPRAETVLYETSYDHPLFDAAAIRAQERLWSLQGVRNTWFCGAHFGSGFHEDGLQSGLAVAEQLGDVRRPWRVDNESGRIHVSAPALPPAVAA